MNSAQADNQEPLTLRVGLPDRIDQVINLLKWPAAFSAALITPLLAWALLRLIVRVATSPLGLIPFLLGTGLFFLVWKRFLRDSRLGKLLITFEHESTHALFALLSGHRITGFQATQGRGQVRFHGGGNWLISVAPYFFPTLALLLFLFAYLLPFPGLPWQSFLLGVALGYHLVSTIHETHRDQSDLKDLGLAFCAFFLPAANLAVVGLLISFAHGGSAGTNQWFYSIWEPIHYAAEWWSTWTSAVTSSAAS